MEEQELSVNIEQVADVQTEAVGTEGDELLSQTPDEAEAQTSEDNARFAETRRKEQLEAKTKRVAELEDGMTQIQEKYERLSNTLTAMGYHGSPQDITDQIEAHNRNLSVDEVIAERDTQQNATFRQAEAKRESNFYRQQYNKSYINQDVKFIGTKYPDIEVMEDLPSGFMEIMATGKINDPMKVFELLQPQRETPPSSGSVKSTQTMEREFYSEKEADGLTGKELDNPRIFEKVMKSMSRW